MSLAISRSAARTDLRGGRRVTGVPTVPVDWLEDKDQWPGRRSFTMVEGERTVGDETTSERCYFISGRAGTIAKRLGHALGSRWGIEDSLHWVLDLAFDEDGSRIRQGDAAKNRSLLSRIALNLVKHETSLKVGVKTKHLRAGRDEQYLLTTSM